MLERLLHKSPDGETVFLKSDCIFHSTAWEPEPLNENIAKERSETEVLWTVSQAGLSALLSK